MEAVTVTRKSCPKCGGIYPSNAEFCALDGERLGAGDKDILIGRTIGRYEIVSQVGQGGMARLYRAKHKFLPQEFAIKFLFGEFAANPQIVTRFHREAQTVSKIKHPNIVQTVDFGQTDEGLPFMVMEFIEGASLSQFIAMHHPLPLPVVADLAKQLASGLSAAHSQGFVHRDLKPGNVMITERPEGLHATILDFGLVHLKEQSDEDVSKLTRSGQILGTPAYMSPEQIDGTGVSAKTDLYALGIVIHELITGKAPFSGSMSSVMNQHLFESTPELPQAGGIEKIAQQLLQKQPDDRPENAQAVYTRLDELLQSKALEEAQKSRGSQNILPANDEAEVTHHERPKTSQTEFELASVSTPQRFNPVPWLVLIFIGAAFGAWFLNNGTTKHPEVTAIDSESPAPVTLVQPEEKIPSKPKTRTPRKPGRRQQARPVQKKLSPKNKKQQGPAKPQAPQDKKASAPPRSQEQETTPSGDQEKKAAQPPLPLPSTAASNTPKTPEQPKEATKETNGVTETTVEVDFEPPTENPPAPQNTLGSMATDFRNKSQKQKKDPKWMKKRLEELEASSGGRARTADKKQADDYKKSAISAIAKKQLVRAEIELGFCLELVPKHSDCNKLMGIVREEKGDRKGAVKYYRRYLSVTPQAPDRAFIEEKIRKIENEKR